MANEEVKACLEVAEKYFPMMSKEMPDVMRGFKEILGASLKPGKLSTKEKEFVALGIALYARCSYCVVIHTKKCVEAGATREEIMEACGVAVAMGGGPAATYVNLVLKTLDEMGVK